MQTSSHSVLVVDDSKINRRKMEKAAQVLGHATIAVENGADALAVLATERIDLVLLDIEMPVLDGFGVLAAMRDDVALVDIPVIVISAIEDMDSVVRAIELGAQDFLPKDFEKVLFAARVGSCLEQKRLMDLRADALAEIEAEKARVDALLGATLPAAAISELKETNQVRPKRHENVVVLFADVVGFTQFCDLNPPELAVSRLQGLINGFEQITADEGLEKIKTIGDAFMATAGLLQPIADPVQAAARCALQMVAAAPGLTQGWQVRVGIHVGPVIAGVIGQQQHLYDLWGDTVNTAARVTGVGTPSTVCITGDIHAHLNGRVTALGNVKVKGKAPLDVFQLEGLD
ncbi:adenylate/guanylate cyclase domain-containing protein [uncultured Tateyamaria sp.]|uniref:adenylate/guanylate cyclase domain-containing protein n=1 Tax=uncultured Tateyamaria sp. TaxID=455651 RepID=UPI00260F4507|nr:adenylate/guanylate cyclase domain-containing protein [uncultured Tateyamaria sp.]